MSVVATARTPRALLDFDLKELVPVNDLAAELGRSEETARRWWNYEGLPTVKAGRTRYTTRLAFRLWMLAQSGAADAETLPTPTTSRARAAELARVDRELDEIGIR